MDVIDDEGRLFGVVNAVDALVLVLTLSVVVAGVAFVDPFGGGEPATRYATVDLGNQPSFRSGTISAGDRVTLGSTDTNFTVTDVYTGPGNETADAVLVRLRVTGTVVESGATGLPQFQVGDAPFRPGRRVQLDAQQYRTSGTVTSVETDGRRLSTGETALLLETTLPAPVSTTIEAGDTYEVGGRTAGTIRDVQFGPGENATTRHALLAVSLRTVSRSGTPHFGDEPVTVGSDVRFKTDEYSLEGKVTELGTGTITRREPRVTLETTVDRNTARGIEAGDAYRIAGRPVATVRSVRTFPASGTGQRRVSLDVQLRATERGGEVYFGNRSVKLGTELPLRTSSYDLTARISDTGDVATDPTGTTTVVLKLGNVAPEVADSISVGMTEESGGETLARVTDKRVEPAVVVLTSDDGNIYRRTHPENKDLYLTVQLQTTGDPSSRQFHGEPLRTTTVVRLDLGTIEINGRVIGFEP